MGADCIFCKIVAGVIPAAKVFEDKQTIAFLDIGPLAEGHLLLIPRAHYAQITDLPAELSAAMAAVLPRLASAVLAVTGAAGLNILQNNGRAAGQVVDHVHVHLIPRREGDGLGFRWNAGSYAVGRADELTRRLRAVLS